MQAEVSIFLLLLNHFVQHENQNKSFQSSHFQINLAIIHVYIFTEAASDIFQEVINISLATSFTDIYKLHI